MDSEYRAFIDNEYKDHHVYALLAQIERNGARKSVLQRLADIERNHSEFWQSWLPSYRPKVSRIYLGLIALLRLIFGVTFVVKMLENHEKQTLKRYRQIARSFGEEDNRKEAIEKIINEEVAIETNLVANIDEAVVKYAGFMMLGLADAIIEVTGVQTGFLGVTSSALVAGLAGLIVGVAAAISMGAAAYLQSRQNPSGKHIIAGAVTGVMYLATVLLIASPYFFVADTMTAFIISISISTFLVALFTFFISVIHDRSFKREFFVSISLLASVILITFYLGKFLGEFFGISQNIL